MGVNIEILCDWCNASAGLYKVRDDGQSITPSVPYNWARMVIQAPDTYPTSAAMICPNCLENLKLLIEQISKQEGSKNV